MKIARKNREIVFGARPGQARIQVIDRYKQPILQRIRQQAFDVVAAPLQFDMVVLADPVDAGVHLCAAGHRAGDFFAQKEIGIAPQLLNCVDRIVIRDRDEVHAALFQPCIQRVGLVIRLQA